MRQGSMVDHMKAPPKPLTHEQRIALINVPIRLFRTNTYGGCTWTGHRRPTDENIGQRRGHGNLDAMDSNMDPNWLDGLIKAYEDD